MAEARQALVLHLAGGGEPVWIAVSGQTADELAPRLSDLVTGGGIQEIETADGRQAVINFHHVAFAMLTTPPPLASSYGNSAR
ncbi:MAG TPA: hypothetical protein VFM37_11340 [Pseudonocardiaceae bacterium]|nr:hypothetical protein [Pseudonocardiaceae bacterium]